MKVLLIEGMPPMYTNTYLVVSEGGHAAVIDPAGSLSSYQHALEQNGAALSLILLTHGHYDHVGSLERLKEICGGTVYLDSADAKGDQMFPVRPAMVDQGYREGEDIVLDEVRFVPYHTPGHTPGSWCFACGEYLFSGDTLFRGSIGRTDLPGGDMDQMRKSLARLAALPLPDDTCVLPGHEEPSTLGEERRYNPYLRYL